uniref:Uncharacterized protein n=1 Tax=Naja naja TaxID=35670 RepID=A0A8C6X386_NAJNA
IGSISREIKLGAYQPYPERLQQTSVGLFINSVVFGAAGIGKSPLVLGFIQETFWETNILIVEDTYRQLISCDKNICTLHITDTTGSHQFLAMKRLTISKAYAFMLVYSVTKDLSDQWSHSIILLGNKSDDQFGEVLAMKWKCSFMETSAKMNYKVQEFSEELLNLEKEKKCSLQVDGKNSKQQQNKDKLRSKYSVM